MSGKLTIIKLLLKTYIVNMPVKKTFENVQQQEFLTKLKISTHENREIFLSTKSFSET